MMAKEKSMSAEVFRMLWVVAVPALFGEVFWFGEYGGVNEKQDNMLWAVFLATVTFLNVMIGCYIEVLERRCKACSAISVEQCSSRKVRLAGVERLGIPYSEMTLQTRSKTSRSSSPCVRIR